MTTPMALEHIKVLDVTTSVAGPYCTKLLADYGADVLKVERPGVGDPCRRLGPFPGDVPHPEKGGLFLFLNTNKKGITLDLGTTTGQAVFKRLVEQVDVVVEDLQPGQMASWGLDFEVLRGVNPGLVMVSISDFGQTGPYRDFKAQEITIQAMGGLMYNTGLNSREPLKIALSQAQFWAGILGASATVVGTLAAQASGRGQHVDLSKMEAVASGLQGNPFPMYTYAGLVRWRIARPEGVGINGIVPCGDGYVIPSGARDDWSSFAKLLEAPELLAPEFATEEARARHRDEFVAILRKRLNSFGRLELFHKAQALGIMFGVVQEPEDLAKSEQLHARGFWQEIDHPVAGRVPIPGAPFTLTETPWSVRRPAPLLGEHNEEVLCGALGYSREQLVHLRHEAII